MSVDHGDLSFWNQGFARVGIVEEWNIGMMGFKATKCSCCIALISRLLVVALFQYSTIPTFHYSGLIDPGRISGAPTYVM
ncbi:MAG: hypothetical protein CVU64_05250 [Deltaproteobacteria bacterium HGW-Deltaproteobacteria-21]|nr:MAG: hypothetical protein CVU64_05250 [Deltaproteobacteria bacterium HGW-Deltaproteobacteria-21]